MVAVATVAAAVAATTNAPVWAAPPPHADSSLPGTAVSATPAQDPPRPTNLTPMDNGYGASRAQRQAMAAAAVKARATGKPVLVDAVTSETQQLVAQPHGGFTLSATPGPVRTRQRGGWVPVSTTLHHNADGSWSPAATAYGSVRFSGGGPGPLAVTSAGGLRYTVTWPTRLPSPTVSGSAATYRNALGAGIDLVMSATDTGGFSDTLVVSNHRAATSPALATLRLSTTVSGGRQTPGHAADGILVAGPGGMVLESGTPQMWDSNTTVPASGTGATIVAPDRSDTAHPGLAALVAPVHTTLGARAVTLLPDAGMLHNPATVFPVYVDPTLNWHVQDAPAPSFDEIKSGAPCNHVSYFNNTGAAGNYGYLGVGWNGWNEGCNGIERALYQWKIPAAIWGATIQSATVNATEVYASTCSTTSTITLHESGGIGSGTKWNNRPGYTGKYATSVSYASASNPTYCPNNGDVAHSFVVNSRMATAATQHWSQWTIALTNDGDESSHNRNGFKRFAKNPVLAINYDRAPATPSAAVMAAKASSTNAGCATTAPYPIIGKTIVSNTPTLNTKVTDPDTDKTQTTFKYWIDGSATTHTGTSGDNLANNSTATFSLPATFTTALTNGQVVDWQAQVTDGLTTSGWSTVCHFAVQPTGPDAPIIQPNTVYPDTSDGGATGAAAGTAATWGVAGATTGATSVKFVYGLDQPPATSSPPPSHVLAPTGTVGSTPAGRWQANEGTGTTLADSSGNSHPATAANTTWITDATRGKAATFNGTSSYAATTGPVLTTNQPFSVSAWVNISTATTWQTMIGQDGSHVSGFNLQWDPGTGKWDFAHNTADANSVGATRVESAATATLNSWTHLVGTYNPTTGGWALYVNGALSASTTITGPWNATGPLTIGRGQYNSAASDWTKGMIADVQVYQRALNAAEVAAIYSYTGVTVTPLAPGPHTLYVYGVDAAGDVSADDAYPFIANGSPNTSCATLAACFNNTAVSPDNNLALGNADGWHSYSATDLANAGWASGGRITVNGATFTLPAYGSGQADNLVAGNQTITYNYPVPATGSSALMFLAASTSATLAHPGAIAGDTTAPYVAAGIPVAGTYCFDSTNPAAYCPATGTITYTDATTQAYFLTVPDWVNGPSSTAAVVLPHLNQPPAQGAAQTKIYPFSVPLSPGKTVQSVTLPDVGRTVINTNALHIFGMSTRNTTTATVEANGATVAAPSGQSWTGAWANPNEGQYNYLSSGNYSNQTFRVALKPSISGTTVRVKLDDALGTSPLTIGHATVALDAGSPSAVPTGTITNLKFGGNAGVTIPAGGMVYTDPLAFTVTANQYLLVSFTITNSIPLLVQHSWANTAHIYVSAPGSGDHTADTTSTAFTGTNTHDGWFTDVLTDLDVTTANIPTQAVLGDGLIDAWQPNTAPNGQAGIRLSDDLTATEPSTPSPYGTIAEGIESNHIMKDNPETYNGLNVGGPSALSRIDRDILDQPGLTTVVLFEGLDDVLNGATANDLDTNGYTELLSYLQANNINVIAIGLTPCDGYTGDGATGNSSNNPCTATVDDNRTNVNSWLSGYNNPLFMNPWSTPAMFYLDADAAIGIPNTSTGQTALDPHAAIATDHVNLTDAGYAALASAYLGPQDTWPLGDGVNPTDGTIDTTVTTAEDTASNTNNPYLINNLAVGANDATLTGAAAWTNDPTRGGALTLDGATSYAATDGPVLTTNQSFTISAWAKITDTSGYRAVASQDATTVSGFKLEYDAGSKCWTFGLPTDDTATTAQTLACGPAPTLNTWTHLVGVYNTATATISLYVNGTLTRTLAAAPRSWTAGGPLTIGRSKWGGTNSDFFQGPISTVQAWNYALTAPQITALYQQIQ